MLSASPPTGEVHISDGFPLSAGVHGCMADIWTDHQTEADFKSKWPGETSGGSKKEAAVHFFFILKTKLSGEVYKRSVHIPPSSRPALRCCTSRSDVQRQVAGCRLQELAASSVCCAQQDSESECLECPSEESLRPF